MRIGPDTWIAAKVTILRGTTIGRGCVLGAHAVVRGDPGLFDRGRRTGQVVRNRKLDWETTAAQRASWPAALADIERKEGRPLTVVRQRPFHDQQRGCGWRSARLAARYTCAV